MQKKTKRIIIYCVLVAAVIACAVIGYFVVRHVLSQNSDEEASALKYPGFSLEYKIKSENVKEKFVAVSIRLYPNGQQTVEKFSLGKGSIEILKPQCSDDKGNKVDVATQDEMVDIGPINKGTKYVDYSYKVKIGNAVDSKAQGDMYKDLMVFSGENVLLFPYFNSLSQDDMKSIESYISKIRIDVDVDSAWNGIMPYKKDSGSKQNNSIEIEKPDWNTFYNLSKSTYAFGKFETLPIQTQGGYINLFVDSGCITKLTPENVLAIGKIYDFYYKIFNGGLKDYSVVLLRRELEQDLVVLGGVGGKSMGLSLNMKTGDDWYTLSYSMYHAFFDNKIQAKNLHYAPNLWLYKGLADYYADKSSTALTDSIREQYGIETTGSLQQIYNRYLYFSLKNKDLLELSPSTEISNMEAEDEFYYGTKVPLVIDAIENIIYKRSVTNDNLISALVKHADEKEISIGQLMIEILDTDEEKVRNYLSGKEIIPYSGSKKGKEDTANIVKELAKYNQLLTALYRNQVSSYPYDPVALIKTDVIIKEAENRKLKFASDEIQKRVKDYSETIYDLLMQNALRASLCGQKDPSAPDLIYLLNTQGNLKKWSDYANKVGIAYGSSN